MIIETITRRKDYRDKKVWVTTSSHKTGFDTSFSLCEWGNALYIHWKKSDFPNFTYSDSSNYMQSVFAELPFHWGITFYQESIIDGVTFVKIGCDYQHTGDERTYGRSDCGMQIIEREADSLVDSFIKLHESLSK